MLRRSGETSGLVPIGVKIDSCGARRASMLLSPGRREMPAAHRRPRAPGEGSIAAARGEAPKTWARVAARSPLRSHCHSPSARDAGAHSHPRATDAVFMCCGGRHRLSAERAVQREPRHRAIAIHLSRETSAAHSRPRATDAVSMCCGGRHRLSAERAVQREPHHRAIAIRPPRETPAAHSRPRAPGAASIAAAQRLSPARAVQRDPRHRAIAIHLPGETPATRSRPRAPDAASPRDCPLPQPSA